MSNPTSIQSLSFLVRCKAAVGFPLRDRKSIKQALDMTGKAMFADWDGMESEACTKEWLRFRKDRLEDELLSLESDLAGALEAHRKERREIDQINEDRAAVTKAMGGKPVDSVFSEPRHIENIRRNLHNTKHDLAFLPEPDEASFARRMKAIETLMDWLHAGDIGAYLRLPNGHQRPIPRHHWARTDVTLAFVVAQAEARFLGGRTMAGQIVVDADQLGKLLEGVEPQEKPVVSSKCAETKCEAWFKKLVENQQDGCPRREDVLKEARAKFPGLSKIGFRQRIWGKHAPAAWKGAGPKSARSS